jgi:uroporphyrinogen decarboxylase
MSDQPNFERMRTVLLRAGEPDRVPLGDISVHPLLKAGVLGRPLRSLEDEVEFWARAGFDYVPLEAGLQLTPLIQRHAMQQISAHYAADTSEAHVRSWAAEGQGPITSRQDFETVAWPDADQLDYSGFERLGPLLPPGMRVIAALGKVFTCVSWLMGLEGLSFALADDPALVARLFRRVGEFQLRVLENVLRFPWVGAVWHADDVAFKTQLLVSPRLLREHVFPWYAEMVRLARARDVLSVYHSDGALQAVVPDIIDCGFHGLNPIEPGAMDITAVKREFGSRIAIIGNIDLVYTLTRGTPEEVRAEVRQRIQELAPGGGYAVASANSIPEYVPLANFNAMRGAVFHYGRYPIAAGG